MPFCGFVKNYCETNNPLFQKETQTSISMKANRLL